MNLNCLLCDKTQVSLEKSLDEMIAVCHYYDLNQPDHWLL